MSSKKLSSLIVDFPEETESIERLITFLRNKILSQSEGKKIYLKLERILSAANPKSTATFAVVMTEILKLEVLEIILRVESVAGGGIKDFGSLLDVPKVIFDWRRSINVEVSIDDVNTYYIFGKKSYEQLFE